MIAYALQVVNVYKTFFEEDDEQKHPWWKVWQRKPRRLVTAVDRVSFSVRRGDIYGILGPNGSGKSTLIRLISTLLIPDAGQVIVFGQDVQKDTLGVRRLMNRVSVDAAFFKKLSAYENLNYAARLYGMDPVQARKRAGEIMVRMGLESKKWGSPLENLSRGQQQKVAIARALMTAPKLLLLDEPTTGLDPQSKRDVQDFILEVQEQQGATVILTSHDMAESERLCQQIAFIKDGKFVAEGTPSQLKTRYAAKDLEDVFFQVTGKPVEPELEEVAE
ncbi:MAG TPA: ABC transporter ATP-binding protein [Symbiobacteriaceae bacterium]|nr:ABC transporter ATP-binding protein [Symbiobacteriaceae bacterium]